MTHKHSDRMTHRLTMLFAALAVAGVGCGGASNSEVKPDASTGSGGAPPTSGSGGNNGGGGAGTGGVIGGGTGGSVAGTGGTAVGPDASAGNCPARTAFTLGVHIVLDATWPATIATVAGSGKIHLWNRAKFNANGTMLTGETANCGTMLPEFGLNAAGSAATLGTKVSIEVPDAVWDAPTIPKFPNGGTISGWDPGALIKIDHTVALVGLTMADPMAAWPMSYTGIMTVDADGDGKAGFTAIPKEGGGYVAPPTSIGLLGSAPSADRVYLASRTIVALAGKIDSCTEQSGTATITFFDSHVVGCRIKGGGDCTAPQIDFVDQSRTNYKVSTGVFNSKQVKDDATCADVRAALPK
jgi:hypothetical protein